MKLYIYATKPRPLMDASVAVAPVPCDYDSDLIVSNRGAFIRIQVGPHGVASWPSRMRIHRMFGDRHSVEANVDIGKYLQAGVHMDMVQRIDSICAAAAEMVYDPRASDWDNVQAIAEAIKGTLRQEEI